MIARYVVLLPALMIVAHAIKWSAWEPALWVKLVVESLILIPLMHYAITPAVDRALSGWLYAGVDEEQRDKSLF